MSRPLTADDAIKHLRQNPGGYATPETLRALAAQVDADAAGRLTVLYSGPAANGVWSTQVIDAMVEAGEDVRVINKSEAAKFLTSRDFYHALANAYELDDFRPLAEGTYRGPATAWLYHPEHGPWADASGRFADATKGEVVAIVGDADPGRVFGKVEVPHILANPNVTTIEGIPRETLAAMSKPGDTQAAFEMIVARAREHDGLLRVAVPDAINYRGQLLYDKSGTLKVDSREYFEGTAIEGKTPAFEGETRALSRNMNPLTAHAAVGQEHVAAWQRETFLAQQAGESHPARVRGIAGGVALEAGLIAYEWNETRQRAQVFQDTLHNDTAARDAYVRQGAQTTGALAGTAAGVTTAAVLNVGTGGTVALVVGEGYLFGKAAEHGVELWQKHRIYNIASEGVNWEFNGKQWIREDLRADLVDDGRNLSQQQDFAAPPDKARELSAKASAVAVEQALGKVPTPRDPFEQPAGDGGDPWRYQPDRGVWTREVVTAYDINNNPSAKETVAAKGEHAAQLSAQAQRTIDQNLAASPAEIAAQYQKGHKAHGYDQTPAGAMPDAVVTALNPDLLQASDDKHYRRDAQGEWAHDGQTATPNRALELELTRDRLLPALADHQQQLARMPSWQPLTPEEQDKAFLREAYLNRGINREVVPENFDASYLAVQRTRAETGVTAATLVLGQNASGQFTSDGPIHHVGYDAAGEIRIVATTTPQDIAKALTDVRARGRNEDTPQPSSPERTITQATPEERDAREQAQREANRQGLSQEDAQQAIQAAAVGVSARGIAPAGGVARATGQEASSATAEPEVRATTSDPQPSPPTVAATPERELPLESEHAAKIETTTTPERQNAPLTPISADREPQDARTAAAPVPATTRDPDALRLGDRGDSVELLQYRLDRQGYRGPDGEPIPQTGQYGPETEHAVRQFQTLHGVPATGMADQDTRDAVDRALAAQRERERAEQGQPNRSPSPESTPTRATPEPTIAPRTVGLTASGGRDGEDRNEREPEHVARAEAQPTAPTTPAPVPALAHHAATRDEHDDERQSRADAERTQAATPIPSQSGPLLMAQPAHPAHAMYTQALSLIEHGDAVPAGTMTQEEKNKLAAGVVAQFLAEDNRATRIDALYASTHNAPGMPAALIPVQGDPTTAYCRRASIDVPQALHTPLEQSSQTAQKAIQDRQQELAQEQAKEQARKERQETEGPVMRIGPRTLSQGPQGDGGDGGGGDGGGGGG